MSQLERAGQAGALDVATNGAAAKGQVSTLLDMLRQLGGNPSIVAGASGSTDPLNAPFTLYVDPYIGSDRFVGGAYNSHEATGTDEQIIAQKLKRIELQRLECGYSSSRPFKTINRAAIEAAIITSKNWYTYSDPRAHVDCITIVLSGGVHIVFNDPGSSSTSLASWGTAKDPTNAELIAFNPTTGGVLLPRGCSMHGQDLRKTTVRPNWVTEVVDELADYSNRRAIFKVSGTGFFFNGSTMDKIGHAESVHLLDTWHPASQAELNAFYLKIQSSVGTGADLATALLAARPSEYQIVGPVDQSLAPTSAWDTTTGASPYIFNWGTRSDYGMGGAFWDGAKISGLKSMVCANYTGTQQQKDMRCWQIYTAGAWVTLPNTVEGYQQYIDATPDNVRRNPARQSRHISAVNNAYIQKVSIFGIGQSEVTMVDSGGEITDNGGNTTFGGSSALAKGYKGFAFGKDKNWTVSRMRVPLNISEKTSNIRRIELGVVSAISASAITLTSGLAISSNSTTNPAILQSLGYTFASGTRIWIDNPAGNDWSTTLTATAWDSTTPAAIGITAAPLQSGTNAAAGNDVIGRRVYMRRVVDTRTVNERRVSILLNNTATARLPQRNAVLQTDPTRAGGGISRVLAGGGEEVVLVTSVGVGATPGSGVLKTAEITIRRGAASVTYAAGVFTRQGTIVKHAGKHWQAKTTFVSAGSSPDPQLWSETFVHMPSDFNPEDSINQESPIIVLDTDTSDVDSSTTLGIDWSTAWTSAGPIRDQYRTSSDYLGLYALLRALGFTDSDAHTVLRPRPADQRDRDPLNSPSLSGGAATGPANWAVEFRRPSTIRLYNHQWEWAGFGNYSKAMPAVQGDMSESNKFTYYFTSAAGGRVTPKGSNEDGFEVSPRGLEDIATGATVGAESLSGQNIDEAQRTDFPNGIQVGGTAALQDVTIDGTVDFGFQSQAKINKPGAVRAASFALITATGVNAPFVDSDTAIENNPDMVTIGSLNRWRVAQRLVSTATDTITIFVNGTAADRNLDQMLSAPPTSVGAAIPTLARASQYANAVIGGSSQTAEIRIAPGLYDPASVWQVNVKFVAYNAALTAPIWASNFIDNVGTTANNYFDGSGYANLTSSVNFIPYRLVLRGALGANNQLHINTQPRTMFFDKSVDFIGGFHCLGLAELIKAVSNGAMTASQLLAAGVMPASNAYTTNLATNVDTLINAIRVANNVLTPTYQSWTFLSFIQLNGGPTDTVHLRDLVIGPGLPSRKGSLGGNRDPFISINGAAIVKISNLYVRGKTRITSAGMGVTNTLPDANADHYGSAAVATPWVWEQTYHTLIGTAAGALQSINLRFGNDFPIAYNSNPSNANGYSYFQDGSGKLLPNHIHLLTNEGLFPADADTGPFFDQFIHAPLGLNVVEAWSFGLESEAGPTVPRLQGFYGKFGSNGYNTTKTRGVLGGNAGTSVGVGTPEEAFTFSLLSMPDSTGGRSIFQRAGVAVGSTNLSARPTYNDQSQTFGTAFPTGSNPVITTDTSGGAGLNVALRSFRKGISAEFATTIQPTNVIL
jgi:hypothetical protein